MEYLAHSAKADRPAQSYASHVEGVCRRAKRYAEEAERYSSKSNGQLLDVVRRSALWHDLGKLDDDNQSVLRQSTAKKNPLPWNHTDAGSALLLASGCTYSALAVYSHHRGLPDIASEFARDSKKSRDSRIFRDDCEKVRKHFDGEAAELKKRHSAIVSEDAGKSEEHFEADQNLFIRMALSCLADADHTDTAAHYGQAPDSEEQLRLRAEQRLKALDRYVSKLGGNDERSLLRAEMYAACRDAKVQGAITACDSPVGSGKTTAVMAHLLRQAVKRNARRIFVVLPYTNIITQSVKVYREALVLAGENPQEVVAELHSRADFQDRDARCLTALWRAPIIVTTAVAFFETLASNRPSALRRLHELPGSVVFVDEAHNALPIKLLPLAWRWINVLADEWNCYWVLASGSLVRYWQLNNLEQVEMARPIVAELVNEDLRERLLSYEQHRVSFRWKPEPQSRSDLTKWVRSTQGPRLLILNTVQSAAVLADDLCRAYGRACVEHLSTALTPEDRSRTIERVKSRLADESDTDWTLVATSCVETGVDFSFRSGFRELSSLLSLLQASGRVNRSGKYREAFMWSFSLQDDSILRKNPAFDTSREVLKSYLTKNMDINPQLSTKSMNDELIRDDSCIEKIISLNEHENAKQFKTIDREFVVIESPCVQAVVDDELAKEIAHGRGDWQRLQKQSISIRPDKKWFWRLRELTDGLYQWTLNYDSFLGYMRGVLDLERSKNDTLII